MITVAALYIDPRGPYPALAGVECWDEKRDARGYIGPHPVVAHPPCGPWGAVRHLCGYDDDGRGPHAVACVRRFGGVLEHPKASRLFAAMGLPQPGELPDAFGGVTIEVEQVRWGHVARKRTWLYLVGVRDGIVVPPPREPTHWCTGHRYTGAGGPTRRADAPPGGIKVCSAQQRRRTPRAFAEWLVALARRSREQRETGT